MREHRVSVKPNGPLSEADEGQSPTLHPVADGSHANAEHTGSFLFVQEMAGVFSNAVFHSLTVCDVAR